MEENTNNRDREKMPVKETETPHEHTILVAPIQNNKSLIFKSSNEHHSKIRVTENRRILQKYVWLHNIITWMQSINMMNSTETTRLYLKDEISGEIEAISFCRALDLLTVNDPPKFNR